MTLDECNAARLALDWNVDTVESKDDGNFPKGCYRQQKEEYRFLHSESSYVWYFNNADAGQPDSNSEPICKGNAKLSCLCTYICKIV